MNDIIDIPVSKYVLLTGAGFTHNFGGFLAQRMWIEIHNNYQRFYSNVEISQTLLDELKHEFDFEKLYQKVIDLPKHYSKNETDAFLQAVYSAYSDLDATICKYIENYDLNNPLINTKKIELFFKQFYDEHSIGDTFFFTLNQDIFFERCFSGLHLSYPSITNDDNRFNGNVTSNHPHKKLKQDMLFFIPSTTDLKKYKEAFKQKNRVYYIKLHGSFDWRKKDNEIIMVIGQNKSNRIVKEPILEFNFQLFKEVLSFQRRHLLIIGYGFGDKHINEVIAESCRNSDLRLFIITPETPESLKRKIWNIGSGGVRETIWNSIMGYYQFMLKDIFPWEPKPEQGHFDKQFYSTFFT